MVMVGGGRWWWRVLVGVAGGSVGGGWMGCGSSKGVCDFSSNLYFSLVSLTFRCIPLKLGVPENPFP